MNEKLKEKVKESLSSVLPITLIVLVLSVTLVPMEIGTLALFLTGAVLLIVGMGFFQLGAEMSMTPLGEGVGKTLAKREKVLLVVLVAFALGTIITIAEPDLQVLANQVASIPNNVLIWTVAVGVGVFLALAVLRILFRVSLAKCLLAAYALLFVLTLFSPKEFLAVAFDAGGVTTGPITVPFIMALGVGVSAIRSTQGHDDDSFGLVALCSVGPILMVLLLGIFYHPTDAAYSAVEIAPVVTTRDVARQFALMTDAGYENFISSCITSFGIYTEILATWEEFPEKEEQTREYLYKATGREFRKPKSLAHTSDIVFHLREEIARKAKYRLVNAATGEPLRVVEHIGCHYAKIFPKAGIGGSEFPYVLAGMIDAWGGQCVDYPERRHCCGFGFRNYLVQANRGYSVANSHKKLESMAPYKPDFIVANCPGCAMFLDKWQYTIAEMEGVTYGQDGRGIPVLTYEEMAGLVLGYDPWELGMQMHQVDVEPLLEKMGIDYDPAAKYLGRHGKFIGKPAPSAVNCGVQDMIYNIKAQ